MVLLGIALALALGIDQGLTTAGAGLHRGAPENRIERSSVAQRELAELRCTRPSGRSAGTSDRKVPDRGTAVADRTPTARTTPGSYLGYERLARFVGSRVVAGKESTYRFPLALPPDHLAYAGRLRVEGERIVTGAGAGLRLRFLAREVNLVLGGRGTVQVLLDGRRRATVAIRGEPRLYNLLRRPRLAEGVLELRFTPGLSAYAFTFG